LLNRANKDSGVVIIVDNPVDTLKVVLPKVKIESVGGGRGTR